MLNYDSDNYYTYSYDNNIFICFARNDLLHFRYEKGTDLLERTI